MDYDTLKEVNDNLKRFNGKLLQKIDALKKQYEALKQQLESKEKNFNNLSLKVQDLMIKNDELTDKKEGLKRKNKELEKNVDYLKSIIDTLQKNRPEEGVKEKEIVKPKNEKHIAILKEKIKEVTEGKYLNPVYDRLSNMMGIFFENSEVNSNVFKDGFNISRATFARDSKILKDMGYIELLNSKKEGMYVLTKTGKKFKKEYKKEIKKAPI